MPGLGAFAMITSVRSRLGESAVFSLEDCIGDRRAKTAVPGIKTSHWPWYSCPSMPKIITYNQREDEPRRSHCAPQRTADLRLPNARIIDRKSTRLDSSHT